MSKAKDAGSSVMQTQQMHAAMADTYIEHMCLLDIDSEPAVSRNTGIVCTIGQSLQIFEVLTETTWYFDTFLICSFGMSCLNEMSLSADSPFQHRARIPICRHGQGNDQSWDEHCKNELLSWHPRSEWKRDWLLCLLEHFKPAKNSEAAIS